MIRARSMAGAPGRRWLFPVMSLLLASGPAPAQDTETFETRETLPQEVVLVVRLISSNRVIPTTGVVVSDDGLVVVPDAFVDEDEETVVLDTGPDIARHGRPATVVRRAPETGLALLRAPGLQRPAIVLADNPGSDGEELRLGAFPPAELLAAGAGPAWLPATLEANAEAGIYGLAESTPIPNLSGPLFNRCGQWAGYSVAIGEPRMSTGLPPIVVYSPELSRSLARLGVDPFTAPCEATAPSAVAETAAAVAPPEQTPPPGVDDVDQTAAPEPAAVVSDPQLVGERAEVGELLPDSDGRRTALGLAAALTLAGLTAAGLWLRRRRVLSAAEPDTRVLVAGPRGGATDDAPLSSRLPPGADRWLILREVSDARRDWRCGIGPGAFSVVIGREGADLVVPHASMSRAHARCSGEGTDITLEDLGSRNGTYLGNAPCLPGERFRIGPGETLGLGGLWLQLLIERPGSER